MDDLTRQTFKQMAALAEANLVDAAKGIRSFFEGLEAPPADTPAPGQLPGLVPTDGLAKAVGGIEGAQRIVQTLINHGNAVTWVHPEYKPPTPSPPPAPPAPPAQPA